MSTTAEAFSAQGVTWNLSALFTGTADPRIDETWAKSMAQADQFAEKYRGKVASLSPAEALQAVQELESLSNDSSKPAVYAGLLFAADVSDPKVGAFMQSQMEKSSSLRVKLMFFELELQKAPESVVGAWLEHAPLAAYSHFLHTTRAYTPYMLSEAEEVLLEETSNVGSRAWVRLHDEVTSNHVYRFANPETGQTDELSQEQVMDHLRDPRREFRVAAGSAITKAMQELERVIGFTYNTLLADKKLEDRLRKFDYPEESRHLANELDKQTVDLVTGMCRNRSDIVARYYRVKRQILGLPELTHVDRYAPLTESKKRMSWGDAKALVLDAFGQFSPLMAEKAGEFFEKDWIDAEPRAGKTGGAFCNYVTPDLHPVMLMSYLGGLDDVGTLAHELGHCVHASLSRAQTPFNYHGTLPLAELASIFGEMLVFEKITESDDVDELLALYAGKIESIFASVHRQAAMFRFEQRCHTKRRESGELAPEDFQAIWQDEMQSMFDDGVKLGDEHKWWWQYVGHFFFAPFYVYAYSFGELLTLSIYQMAKKEGPGFAAKYTDVLTLGGSKTPDELMAMLGVDLHSPEFWEGGFAAIEGFVANFESLWAKKNR